MECPKCGFKGGREAFHFVGNANFSGTIAFRKCPECGHLVQNDEVIADEQYKGLEPWGMNKFRGRVFKGKKQ